MDTDPPNPPYSNEPLFTGTTTTTTTATTNRKANQAWKKKVRTRPPKHLPFWDDFQVEILDTLDKRLQVGVFKTFYFAIDI